MTNLAVDLKAGHEVMSRLPEEAARCYQCHKCAAGCPMADAMDVTPAQLLRLLQMGRFDVVKRSQTMWLCAGCETCSVRCPNGVRVADVMDHCKQMALEQGFRGKGKKYAMFHRLFMIGLRWQGRLYELGLMGAVKVVTLNLFSDLDTGLNMLLKGKLKLFPSRPVAGGDMKRLYAEAKKRGER